MFVFCNFSEQLNDRNGLDRKDQKSTDVATAIGHSVASLIHPFVFLQTMVQNNYSLLLLPIPNFCHKQLLRVSNSIPLKSVNKMFCLFNFDVITQFCWHRDGSVRTFASSWISFLATAPAAGSPWVEDEISSVREQCCRL